MDNKKELISTLKYLIQMLEETTSIDLEKKISDTINLLLDITLLETQRKRAIEYQTEEFFKG